MSAIHITGDVSRWAVLSCLAAVIAACGSAGHTAGRTAPPLIVMEHHPGMIIGPFIEGAWSLTIFENGSVVRSVPCGGEQSLRSLSSSQLRLLRHLIKSSSVTAPEPGTFTFTSEPSLVPHSISGSRFAPGTARPGGGWLIFGLPPSEVAVHPGEGDDHHEFYLMCDDIRAFVEEMRSKNVELAGSSA